MRVIREILGFEAPKHRAADRAAGARRASAPPPISRARSRRSRRVARRRSVAFVDQRLLRRGLRARARARRGEARRDPGRPRRPARLELPDVGLVDVRGSRERRDRRRRHVGQARARALPRRTMTQAPRGAPAALRQARARLGRDRDRRLVREAAARSVRAPRAEGAHAMSASRRRPLRALALLRSRRASPRALAAAATARARAPARATPARCRRGGDIGGCVETVAQGRRAARRHRHASAPRGTSG